MINKLEFSVRGKMKKSFVLLFIALLSFSCTSTGGKTGFGRGMVINIKTAEQNEEIDAVVASAFENNFDFKDLEASVNLLLKKYPHNGKLNEVAAFISLLKSDNSKMFFHLIKSVLDSNNENTPLMLDLLFSMNLGLDERDIFIKTLNMLTSSSKNYGVRQMSRNILSYYHAIEGDIAKTAFEVKSNGFIKDWWVIGGFDNDSGKGFYDEYEPEKEFNLNKKYKGKVVDVSWRKIKSRSHGGTIQLSNFVSPSYDSLAYMATTIFSPVEKEVILNVSTGDAIKIWVNGTLAFEEDNIVQFGYDNIKVKVKFSKGENVILIKTCQKDRGWSVGLRITELSGKESLSHVVLHDFPKQKTLNFVPEVLFPYPDKEPVNSDVKENLYKALTFYFKGYDKYFSNYMKKAFEVAPQNFIVMLYMTSAFNNLGEDGKNIDLLNGAITHSSSGLPLFLILRGDFFAKKGQKESAESDYMKALELNPKSISALGGLVYVFKLKGWHEDARQTLLKALDIKPDCPRLLVQLASIMENLNYKEDAERIYRKALSISPGDISLNEKLFDISKEKRIKASMFYFIERMIEIAPEDMRNHFDFFELYRTYKDIENAFNQLNKIKKLNPDNPQIYVREGNLFYELNKVKEALASWERAHELDPKNSYISERISYLKVEESDAIEKYVPDEEKIMEAVKESVNFNADDGAQVLLVYDHAVCRVNSDGSSKWYITEVSRALNDDGRDSLINSYLPYDGRKRILKAYSINSNFEKSEASSVSNYEVRFRQLKKGDFTVVQYVHYKPGSVFLENDFDGQWYVQNPMVHMLYSEWNLVYPKGTNLKIDTIGNRVEQSFEELEGLTVHKFIARNIEPLNYEPGSPPLSNFIESISVSTAESWDKYVNWEKALLKDVFVSAKEIRDKAIKIVENETTTLGKINKIFEFVAQEIRYQQEYESVIAGVKPHTAAQTLERGYGDCKDKAVLFIQLAKELNIKVDYVLVRTRNAGKLERKIPKQQFNHAIVYIPSQEGIESGFFMDPTVDLLEIGNLREDDQGAAALKLEVETGKYEILDIPFQSPELNFQKYERTYALSEKGVFQVNNSLLMRGDYASYFRQALRTKDTGQKVLQRLTNSLFRGGVLSEYNHSDIEEIFSPLKIDFSADVSNLVSESENKVIITMPEQLISTSTITLEKRKLPLWTGVPSLYEFDVKIEIPEQFKVESTPNDLEFTNEYFSISRKSTVVDEKTIIIKSYFLKKSTEISVENYSEFRNLVLEVIKKHNESLVLIKE